MEVTSDQRRQALDLQLAEFRAASRMARPASGWIRAIRQALGLSTAELARLLDVAQPSVVGIEQSEAAGRIRLDTLAKAAAALDCSLVYALVPNTSLERQVEILKVRPQTPEQ